MTRPYQLHQGDALAFMATLPDASVDAIITDPPYDAKTHEGADPDFSPIDFPPLPSVGPLVTEFLRVSRGWVITFCSLEMLGEYQEAAGPAWVRAGIWDRISNMPQLSGDRPAQGGEGVAIMHPTGRKRWNGGGKAAIWRYLVERGQKQHPTQKPLDLMSALVTDFTNPGDLILDPFAGSGTTGVAALKNGRRFMGSELSPEYHAVALKRLQAAHAQPRLLEAL